MRVLVIAALISTVALPAIAGQAVTLKAEVVASGPVTLGDLFDGAGKAGDVRIATVNPAGSIVLDAATVQRAAMNAGLSWSNETGLRRVIVRGAGSAPTASTAAATAGPAAGGVEVLTYNRSLQTGEIVQPEDLTWTKLAAAPAGAPRDAEALIGKAAKRPLRSGAAATTRDVTNPLVIKRDDMVEVAFSDTGVSLTLQARAMEQGAVGDSITVMNPSSKKLIQAVVAGPGKAVVGPLAQALRAESATSNQFAFR